MPSIVAISPTNDTSCLGLG